MTDRHPSDMAGCTQLHPVLSTSQDISEPDGLCPTMPLSWEIRIPRSSRLPSCLSRSLKMYLPLLRQLKRQIGFPYLPDLTHQIRAWFEGRPSGLPARWGGLCTFRLSDQLKCLDLSKQLAHIAAHWRDQYLNGLNDSVRV